MADGSHQDHGAAAPAIRVKLHPFIHQVGGSSLMFKLDDRTICKPLLPKEHHFYKILPQKLKKFTPQYKGSITIEYEEMSDGTCTVYGIVSPEEIQFLQSDPSVAPGTSDGVVVVDETDGNLTTLNFIHEDELRVKKSGSIEISEDSLDNYDNPMDKIEMGSRLNKKLAQLLDGPERMFILLENLVANFEYPSILDLKMGTRTYGDDETDAKKMRKRQRAANSTSKLLGVRLHGMQKFNTESSKYEMLDKSDGLKMTKDQFDRAVINFFFDGTHFRKEIIKPILQRLQQFHECVSAQDTFRFYSSSLLIMYDGRQLPGDTSVDVRAIDFAHTTYQYSPHKHDIDHAGPDTGYLQGLKTLINIFTHSLDKMT